MRRCMRKAKRKFRSGVSLIELAITSAMSVMLISAVGILLVSSSRAWQNTYSSAHKKIRQDAMAVTVAFGAAGRKSNRLDYRIYNVIDGVFYPAAPETAEPRQVVSGDAVEFRYWDTELDQSDTEDLMDVAKTATAYALFYIEGAKLKVDYGQYPPGGVPEGGGKRNKTGVETVILAENVSTDTDNDIGAFSHTTLNGVGEGSVRINIVLTDPGDGETIRVMTATLMRNLWPR
jgi:hypothetical protein